MRGVYQIRNSVNGKVYVGSALDVDARFACHRSLLNARRHHSRKLQSAWLKHGAAAFEFTVLEVVADSSALIGVEQRWMDLHGAYGECGYNICRLAGSRLGVRHSEATKRKLRAASSGKAMSPETRAKLSAIFKGRKHSAAAIKKMAESQKGKVVPEPVKAKMRGRVFSDDHRRKLSESHKGKKHTATTLAKMSASRKGRPSPMRGRTHSPEAKARIAKASRSRPAISERTRARQRDAATRREAAKRARDAAGTL